MIVFTTPEQIPGDFGPAVVAIGKFDGVHSGHQAIIAKMRQDASALGPGVRTVVVTFDRHPLSVIAPEKCPTALIGGAQKLQLLAATGIDATLVLRFDAERAAQAPREFVKSVLVEHLHATTVLVGTDFRFGRGGAGDVPMLREFGADFGFAVDEIGDVQSPGAARRISSTWIREALEAGDVETATTLLDRLPSMRGEVVHGLKRGRELGFPTANLAPEAEGVIPGDGVYAGWLIDYGPRGNEAEDKAADPEGARRYPTAISVGDNPTFIDVPRRQVEAHILDVVDIDLYGHIVDIQFVQRIRGMVAYEGIEPLIKQIAADVAQVREVLA